MYKKIKFLFLAVILFLAGIAIGKWFLNQPTTSAGPLATDSGAQEFRQGGYKFINPLLECEISSEEMVSVRDIKDKVTNLVNNILTDKNFNNVSVYFRDLNNGPWFGINAAESFSPASLLKVPLLIAFLKQAEADPQSLKKEITFNGFSAVSQEAEPNFPPSQKIEIGKTYSVEDLLYRMIVYSDNDAKDLLRDNIDTDFVNQVYKESGINLPEMEGDDYINVRDYASIFRFLFNASYLDRHWSEYALDLLSKSEFKEGLVAGVGSNIDVAHKFGERTFVTPEGQELSQFHDCGIIYYPSHPYLLCIMTRGKVVKDLVDVIKDISGFIYKEVDKRYGAN